jgi:hypothetical protein
VTAIPNIISEQIGRVSGNRYPPLLEELAEAIEDEDNPETLRRMRSILKALAAQAHYRQTLTLSR